jgi:hypothetical protein
MATIGNIEILKKYNEGVTFIEALKLAEGKRLISNKEADAILQDEQEYEKYKDLFYCWTGTLLIYEAPSKPFGDKPFGEFVKDSSTGWIIDVPKRYQGKKDCALIIEHPHFKIQKGKYDMTFIMPDKDSNLIMLPEFPTGSSWHIPEPSFGIPIGKTINSDEKEARYLYRRDGASIRPLCRYNFDFNDGRRDVDADRSPYDGRLGVGAVETLSGESVSSERPGKK